MIDRLVPSEAVLERARDCLANKTRSYVNDAQLFAAVLLRIAAGENGNGVVRAPDDEPKT